MEQSVLQNTLLTLGLTFTTTFTPTPAPPQLFTEPVIKQQVVHVVEEGETLSSIAKQYYGSSDYWTSVLNDNPDISSLTSIEIGKKIKIREKKPLLIEELNDENKQKIVPISDNVDSNRSSISAVQVSYPLSDGIGAINDTQIAFLGNCESGMNPETNTGNGFYGAFQFTIGTWNSMGTEYARADLAPLHVQVEAVQRLLSRSSIWTQFPGCAHRMQNAGLL